MYPLSAKAVTSGRTSKTVPTVAIRSVIALPFKRSHVAALGVLWVVTGIPRQEDQKAAPKDRDDGLFFE